MSPKHVRKMTAAYVSWGLQMRQCSTRLENRLKQPVATASMLFALLVTWKPVNRTRGALFVAVETYQLASHEARHKSCKPK
mmetsp:Transcript_12087/g.25205  ORF Transcript_12087/g.25205 Transcript_12087/m.25205 type:complete len:81 (+) Transcript_12087:385-627(+)